MKYIVITSKHHDGFALYPSEASKWNIAEATPYKKDLLGPLVGAAKAEGLKIGFYYSHSQDWNNPGGAKSGFKEGDGWDDVHKGSYDAYLKNVAVPQTREILTRYPIDIRWWDTPMHITPERASPLAALTKFRPGLITNNRLGGGFGGDTAMPEQFVPVTGYPGDWETCMTLNSHWGYNAYDHNWEFSTDLIRKLADICAKGGNFLLNVDPTAEGEFPPACVEQSHEVGQWLRVNGGAIYGTSRSPFSYLSWGVATRKPWGLDPPQPGCHWLMANTILTALGAMDLIGITNASGMFAEQVGGKELLRLIQQQSAVMKDAWLTDIGHKRPQKPGLPLVEAQTKGAEIEVQIQRLLFPAKQIDL